VAGRFGKRQLQFSTPPERGVIINTAKTTSSAALLFLRISFNGTNTTALVDTGAACSLFPKTRSHMLLQPAKVRLVNADASPLKVYGEAQMSFSIEIAGVTQSFVWNFVHASVPQVILGMDFLAANSLIVDTANRKLYSSGSAQRGVQINEVIVSDGNQAKIQTLLQKYADLVQPPDFCKQPLHATVHHIETNGPPVNSRPRRLHPDKLAMAKAEFDKMEDMGIVRRSNSNWASPLHMAPKKEVGQWRPCGDFVALNLQTKPDRYPVPNLHDYNSRLDGSTIFSAIDLVRAYHNIPVAEEDICKTAVNTPFGLFEFPRMPFGLRNAGNTFQRFMDEIFRDMPFVFVYVDDILVASESPEVHFLHLEEVFSALCRHGLRLAPQKCQFAQESVRFLGYTVSSEGTSPLPERISAFLNWAPPTTCDELRRFLCTVSFYRRTVPRFAEISAPLYDVLRATGKATKRFEWSAESDSAFDKLKQALAANVVLQHPMTGPDVSYRLTTDASAVATGAALHQVTPTTDGPIAFASQGLSEKERRLSTFDRELLAAYRAVKKFRHMIEGQTVILVTDHKPLVSAFRTKNSDLTATRQRQLSFIAELIDRVEYVRGVDNQVADALSRPTCSAAPVMESEENIAISPVFTLSAVPSELMAAQQSDKDIESMIRNPHSTSLKLALVKSNSDGTLICCDVSLNRPRPIVPVALRRQVFDALHNVCHPGPSATIRLVTDRYVWSGARRDIRKWASECMACQASKVTRHTKSPIQTIPIVGRFKTLHVDIVGPLASTGVNKYIVTCVDRFTRWPEVWPVSNISAETVADCLLRWVAMFGLPESIISDQGRQFTSRLWFLLTQRLGVKRHLSTPGHPQTNGMVERFHRRLKEALRAVTINDRSWEDTLPVVMLGLRNIVPEGGQAAPSTLVFGSEVALPGEFFGHHPPTQDCNESRFLSRLTRGVERFRPKINNWQSRRSYIPPGMYTSPFVWLADANPAGLAPRYRGPYRVISRRNKTFDINLGHRTLTVSVDRLKPALGLQ
jgi:hypothetical protein